MVWDAVVVDGATVDYAADHNEQTTQIKSRLVGELGLATPNAFIIVNAGGTGATPVGITSVTTLGSTDLTIPTSKAVLDKIISGSTNLTLAVRANEYLRKGQACYISGTSSGIPLASLVDVNTVGKMRVIGIAQSDMNPGDATIDGFLRRGGTLTGVDCRTTGTVAGYVNPLHETWANGDLLFALGSAHPGGLTNIRPTSGRSVKVCYTVNGNDPSGALLMHPMENPVWSTCAAAEDVVLRVGDSIGGNKVSIRNYTNTEIAYIGSTGRLKLAAEAGLGRCLLSDASGNLSLIAPGANGYVQIGAGVGASPVWAALAEGATTKRGVDVTNAAGAITVGLKKAYRTIFLSCAGGWASTTYGDGGSVTTETNATSASPLIFNLKTTLMDTTSPGADRHHEWTAPMPVNWDGGTVTAKPYIMTKGIGVTDDTLILGLQGAAIKHGDAASALTFANSAASSIGASAFFTLSATTHGKLISNVGATSAAGVSTLTIGGSAAVAGGDLIQWRMNRPGFDTYTGGASVFGWMITYGTLNYSDEA